MKMYDYSRKIATPTKKDKQWNWVDEEFRRIWDVLYNKREIYPNQTGSFGSLVGVPKPNAFGTIWTMFYQVAYNAFGTASIQNHGCTTSASLFQQGAVRHDDNYVAPFGSLETATTINSIASVFTQTAVADNNPGAVKFGYSPKAQWFVKTFDTDADIQNCEYWCHLGAAAAGSNVDPKANTNLIFIGFGYDTAVSDTTWKLKARLSAGGSIVELADTGLSVEKTAYYVFDLDLPLENIAGSYGFYKIWRARKFKLSTGDITSYEDTGYQYILSSELLPDFDVTTSRTLPKSLQINVKNILAGTARRLFFKYAYSEMIAPFMKLNNDIPFEGVQ